MTEYHYFAHYFAKEGRGNYFFALNKPIENDGDKEIGRQILVEKTRLNIYRNL